MKREKIYYLIILILSILLFIFKGSILCAIVFLISLLYGLITMVWMGLSGRNFEVSGISERIVEKKETLRQGFSFRNFSGFPLTGSTVSAHVINRLTGDYEKIDFELSLRNKQEKTNYVEIQDEFCGKIDVTAEKFIISDPLHIFKKEVYIGKTSGGYVLPEISRVVIPENYLDSYNMESHQYSQYEKGNDTGEVFGIKEYAEGDSLKSIHWKLSAKMDELMVKIPSFPIENNIIIILDNVYCMNQSPEKKTRNDLVELFFSISNELLERNLPHSIGFFDSFTGEFKIEKISSREDLANSIPACLSSGFTENEFGIAEEYIRVLEGTGFSNHFLVTDTAECDIEKLESYGEVKVFRAK